MLSYYERKSRSTLLPVRSFSSPTKGDLMPDRPLISPRLQCLLPSFSRQRSGVVQSQTESQKNYPTLYYHRCLSALLSGLRVFHWYLVLLPMSKQKSVIGVLGLQQKAQSKQRMNFPKRLSKKVWKPDELGAAESPPHQFVYLSPRFLSPPTHLSAHRAELRSSTWEGPLCRCLYSCREQSCRSPN